MTTTFPPHKPTYPKCEILYINHFKCACGSTFSVPNPKLLYEYEHKTFHKTSITQAGHSFAGLRREIRHTPSLSLEACPCCFKERHQLQGDLPLESEEEEQLTARELKAGPKVNPTPLSEF